MDVPSINDVLQLTLRLYNFANECTVEEFHAETLHLLRQSFSFDGLGWLLVRYPRMRNELIESFYGAGLPDRTYTEWHRYWPLQKLTKEIYAQPERTLLWVPERDEPLEEIKEYYLQEPSLNSCISWQRTDSAGLSDLITIGRFGRQQPLDEAQATVFKDIAPHLSSAHRLVGLRYQYEKALAVVPDCSYALIGENGYVMQRHPLFSTLLLLEWPEWTGPDLPAPLQKLLSTAEERYFGIRITASLQREGKSTHIELRERQLCDRLTGRERQIAEMYAGGMCYKEISRTLNLAPSTVRTRLSNIYMKLDVTTKVSLLSKLNAGKVLTR